MGLFGNLVKGAMGAFPTIPDFPDPAYADIGESQLKSTSLNKAALPGLQDLGEDVNAYNLAERAKALSAGIPGYDEITRTGSANLASQMRGELPDDVVSQIMRQSNSRAYAGGFGGSGASANMAARDLGLSSLALMQQGQAAAPGWLGAMNALAVPPQFDVQSGFVSPGMVHQATQWNELNRVDAEWMQNIMDSIPDPEKAAIADNLAGMADIGATVALTALGGAAGGAIGAGTSMGAAAGSAYGAQVGSGLANAGGTYGQGSGQSMALGNTLAGMMGGGGGGGGGMGGMMSSLPLMGSIQSSFSNGAGTDWGFINGLMGNRYQPAGAMGYPGGYGGYISQPQVSPTGYQPMMSAFGGGFGGY